jgi:hypothetical protein
MSLHSDTISLFRANQSFIFFLNTACIAEKQQIPISKSLVWSNRGSNHDLPHWRLALYNHYTTGDVLSEKKYFICRKKTNIVLLLFYFIEKWIVQFVLIIIWKIFKNNLIFSIKEILLWERYTINTYLYI